MAIDKNIIKKLISLLFIFLNRKYFQLIFFKKILSDKRILAFIFYLNSTDCLALHVCCTFIYVVHCHHVHKIFNIYYSIHLYLFNFILSIDFYFFIIFYITPVQKNVDKTNLNKVGLMCHTNPFTRFYLFVRLFINLQTHIIHEL